MLNVPEAAAHLGITERHLRSLVYKKQIPHYHVGRLLRFSEEDLDAWLLAHRTPARNGPMRPSVRW